MAIVKNRVEAVQAAADVWRNSPLHKTDYRDEYPEFISDNSPAAFLELSGEEQERVADWIENNFRHTAKFVCQDSSYSLKHIYEAETRHYTTNGQFKGAMVYCGFVPYNPHELNCRYRMKNPDKNLKRMG
jgi:hypothetical protein